MRVLIDKTIYYVIEKCENEVCILQTFEYADGLNRQLKIWTSKYKIVED